MSHDQMYKMNTILDHYLVSCRQKCSKSIDITSVYMALMIVIKATLLNYNTMHYGLISHIELIFIAHRFMCIYMKILHPFAQHNIDEKLILLY